MLTSLSEWEEYYKHQNMLYDQKSGRGMVYIELNVTGMVNPDPPTCCHGNTPAFQFFSPYLVMADFRATSSSSVHSLYNSQSGHTKCPPIKICTQLYSYALVRVNR